MDDGFNPYEAPRHAASSVVRRALRRAPGLKEEGFGCLMAVLGFVAGIVGATWSGIRSMETGGLVGLVAAVVAGVAGRLIGRAILPEPTADALDDEQRRAEAKRRERQLQIEVARELLNQATTQGDDEVKARLIAYLAKLQRERPDV